MPRNKDAQAVVGHAGDPGDVDDAGDDAENSATLATSPDNATQDPLAPLPPGEVSDALALADADRDQQLEAIPLGADSEQAIAALLEAAVESTEATGMLSVVNERGDKALSELVGVPFLIGGYKWNLSQNIFGDDGRPKEYVIFHVLRLDDPRRGDQYAITTSHYGIMKQLEAAARRRARIIYCKRGLRASHVQPRRENPDDETSEIIPGYEAFWIA